MLYTIYQITNKIDGKIYIGKHQTEDLNDGYMGSGKHLRRAIEKYGIESFEKKILHVFSDESQMNAKEAELVTEEFCSREDTYNLCPGGHGGWGYINANLPNGMLGKSQTEKQRLVAKALMQKINTNIDLDPLRGMNAIRKKYPHGVFSGRKHTSETIARMKFSKQGHGIGETNSQFGSMWITNGSENKKIKKGLDIIPEGWYKGRVIKHTRRG